jgi:hypothetical protein
MVKKNDLGTPEKEYYGIGEGVPSSPGESKEQRIFYPNFTLKDDVIDRAGASGCGQGQTYILRDVKVRVAEVDSRKTDKDGTLRMEFEIQEIGGIETEDGQPVKAPASESEEAPLDDSAPGFRKIKVGSTELTVRKKGERASSATAASVLKK